MNALRRKTLRHVSDQLEILKAQLEDILQDEEELSSIEEAVEA